MKILIYDIELFSSGIRYPLKEASEELGHNVDMFDWTYYFDPFSNKTLYKRIKDKVFMKTHMDKLNQDLQRIIKLGKYDFFLVLMGKFIYPETVKLAKENIKYVVNWNTDDPMNMLNSTQWLIEALPIYDAHFTPRIHLKDEYERYGMKQLFELDWYYRYGIDPVSSHKKNYQYEGNFIGAWSKRRENFINSIKDNSIDVFGWGWKGKIADNHVYGAVDMIEMMNIFSKSKINLNILTIENRDTTNLRNFEIPAAHGFQLAERSDKLLNFFEEDKEIVFFSSIEEMEEKYNYYLKNDKERIKIATAGFNKIVNGENSLVDRLEQIIKSLDNIG